MWHLIVSFPDLCNLTYFQKATDSLKELSLSLYRWVKKGTVVGCAVILDNHCNMSDGPSIFTGEATAADLELVTTAIN